MAARWYSCCTQFSPSSGGVVRGDAFSALWMASLGETILLCPWERQREKGNSHSPTPRPLPLTLHHPLPSFCSSKDTNGINEGINYRGGKSCWVIHLANMQTTMGILQQLSWAWLTLSVVNTAKMQHRPASLSHSVQCPFTDGYKIKSIAAYSLTLKQRESLLIRVQTCDSNYCAALNCA